MVGPQGLLVGSSRSSTAEDVGEIGIKPIQQASFKVRAAAFPAGQWLVFRKAFKPRQSARDKEGLPWERIDGRGFTLWLFGVRLEQVRAAVEAFPIVGQKPAEPGAADLCR